MQNRLLQNLVILCCCLRKLLSDSGPLPVFATIRIWRYSLSSGILGLVFWMLVFCITAREQKQNHGKLRGKQEHHTSLRIKELKMSWNNRFTTSWSPAVKHTRTFLAGAPWCSKLYCRQMWKCWKSCLPLHGVHENSWELISRCVGTEAIFPPQASAWKRRRQQEK